MPLHIAHEHQHTTVYTKHMHTCTHPTIPSHIHAACTGGGPPSGSLPLTDPALGGTTAPSAELTAQEPDGAQVQDALAAAAAAAACSAAAILSRG